MANNNFITNYFGFNRQQRNGLYVLILISFLLLIIRLVFPLLISPGKIIIKNLPLIERKLDSNVQIRKKYAAVHYPGNAKKTSLFAFDPNTVTFEQLLQLGFSEKKATTFLKFRNRGFIFKEKSDLQKVYGISGKFYESLAPFILINDQHLRNPVTSKQSPPPGKFSKPAKVIAVVELNSADSASLETINGIGATYAKRILKYRAMLGGFVAVEQLKEVYGFNEEVFEKIRAFVSVDQSRIKKINLNNDDFKTINNHPYISYEITKTIFSQRRKAPVTAPGIKALLNDEALYQKLLPYLIFE